MLIFVNLGSGQEKKENPDIVPDTSGACEHNPASLSLIASQAKEQGERIFAIFRVGKNETEKVNAARLIYVKKVYLQSWAKYYKLNVIYARGEKTDSDGQIEYYVGGKLSLVVISPKNKTPCLDCCGTEIFYPQNLVKKRKIIKR